MSVSEYRRAFLRQLEDQLCGRWYAKKNGVLQYFINDDFSGTLRFSDRVKGDIIVLYANIGVGSAQLGRELSQIDGRKMEPVPTQLGGNMSSFGSADTPVFFTQRIGAEHDSACARIVSVIEVVALPFYHRLASLDAMRVYWGTEYDGRPPALAYPLVLFLLGRNAEAAAALQAARQNLDMYTPVEDFDRMATLMKARFSMTG